MRSRFPRDGFTHMGYRPEISLRACQSRKGRTMWQRIAMVFGVLCVLTACTSGPGTQATTPAQVHEGWVKAMQTNDREAAKALIVPELMSQLDNALHEAQVQTHSPLLGDLNGTVTIETPAGQGKGQIGMSRWPFTKQTVCYQTMLADTPDGWKVTGFTKIACS